MSAPTLDPTTPPTDHVTRPDQYQGGARVWVFCAGSWRPGVVLGSSVTAASVRYRPTNGNGTAVDTVLAQNIVPRHDDDLHLDGSIPGHSDPDRHLQSQPRAGSNEALPRRA